ncbi:SNF1-interacting protein, partial [Ascosphaera aggregata]
MSFPSIRFSSQIEKLVNLVYSYWSLPESSPSSPSHPDSYIPSCLTVVNNLLPYTDNSHSPVGLKEAALDSPTFRASVVHFSEQVDIVERWLDGYVRSTAKLTAELSTLESLTSTFLSSISNPLNLSEAVVDYDYTLLAVKLYEESARAYWSSVLTNLRKCEHVVIEPIKAFIHEEIRPFKDMRRSVERCQKEYDNLQSRYASQAKTKEASALREDAFQLHEARKLYLKTSLDFTLVASQFKNSLDRLFVNTCCGQWNTFNTLFQENARLYEKGNSDMARVKGWLDEVGATANSAKKEIIAARTQIEESTEYLTRSSRDLEDYSVSTVAYLGTRGPSFKMEQTHDFAPEKQGWLHLRVLYGKPTRTTWVRRWAFLKNGIFGSLIQGSRTGGVEESERIGVLLCSVRPAFNEERRFCFEVKTKNSTIMLQAETQMDLTEWIGAFEAAKRKSLESPHPGGKHHVQDPAFAISQPPAPEFAAEAYDALTTYGAYDPERGERTSLNIDRDANNRLGAGLPRRTISIDRDTEGRDHTSRLMQKLDIHRKTNTNPPSQGGIASLISAGSSILPINMPLGSTDNDVSKTKTSIYMPSELPPSTFAPTTLVTPPAPTSMSRAAVIVSAESGIGLKAADGAGDVPAGMMANVWGSINWSLLNKCERRKGSKAEPDKLSISPLPLSPPSDDKSLSVRNSSGSRSRSRHRQTMSLTSDLRTFETMPPESFEYPSCYPLALRTQDAQFRLLFPSVPKDEALILVFRAFFCPNDNQDFPGRCYATTNAVYFYSNHLGLVLTSCITFTSISEVTGAPGRDCDFLYLHVVPQSMSDVPARITLKTFLEPLKLLQHRLNYLINISAADELPTIETIFKALIAMENETPAKPSPPKADAWGNTTQPVGQTGAPSRSSDSSVTNPNSLRMGTYVDSSITLEPAKQAAKEMPIFRLPAHPVHYVPQGDLQLTAERDYNISAKALFHVLFGDKSIVWHRMKYWQGARNIYQGPWITQASNRVKREFTFNVTTVNARGRPVEVTIYDYQLIDVMNDHLCYVISDNKMPWQFSNHRSFRYVNKIVLTHVAKSRCKFAVYTTIEWMWKPFFIWRTIEKHAMDDLRVGAAHLMDIVTTEVLKLEAQNNQTKKAIAIFGNIGHKKEGITFAPPVGTDQ